MQFLLDLMDRSAGSYEEHVLCETCGRQWKIGSFIWKLRKTTRSAFFWSPAPRLAGLSRSLP